MKSTIGGASRTVCEWREQGLHYYPYSLYLRARFGRRVQRISLNAGFTCPNVDGTVAVGGCVFCDNRSFSPSRRQPRSDILGQLEQGIQRVRERYGCEQFLAYFQPATNTYAPVDQLRRLYEQVLQDSRVVGLVVGTRPDCVPEPVLALLEELAARTFVTVEYGMQTRHDRSLQWMNRGHGHAALVDAVERSRGRGFDIVLHAILGLPGETRQEMRETAQEVARLGVDAVKIHNLYVVKNTPLAEDWAAGRVRLLDRQEYVSVVVDFLERIRPQMVVDRISGEAPGDYFLAPSWSLDKPGLQQAIRQEFDERGTWQGARY